MPLLDNDVLSQIIKFVSGNKLVQISSEQIAVPQPATIGLNFPWTSLPFPAHRALASYRDPLGRVWLDGAIGGGAAGSAIGVLPAGARPGVTLTFPVATDTGFGTISIDSTGTIAHVSGGTATVWFTGISFRVF